MRMFTGELFIKCLSVFQIEDPDTYPLQTEDKQRRARGPVHAISISYIIDLSKYTPVESLSPTFTHKNTK